MKDRFNRKINYLRVSVTDRCNLRCVYCMPEEGVVCVPHSEILTFDEIERICRISVQLGISRIKLTGGEPLVRRGLPDLLGMLKRISGIEQVTLTTNGILLDEQINKLVSKGLDGVNISIDTLNPERYRELTRGGCLAAALKGLDASLEHSGLRVKVNCVPCVQDEEEYLGLALLAKDRPVEVRFIEMMPIGMGKDFTGWKQDDILKVLESAFGPSQKYTQQLGNGPAVYVQFPGFCGRIGFISAVSHQFCSECNRVRLTSEGYLKPCLQYECGVDLKKLLRGGAGDKEIREAMRKSIFEKPAHHHFREMDKLKGDTSDDPGQSDETKGMSRIGG